MMRKIDAIFQDRTCYKFLDKKVDKSLLKEIYDLMKLGPTSANICPLRIKFVISTAEKEKLYKCVAPTNVEKIKSAPVTAIFAYDMKFYDLVPKLFPINPSFKDYFSSSESIAFDNAFRNSTLQAAYFMMIARGMGLDCGPMSGFDADSVNSAFFSNTNYKVNFICNLGYKDGQNPYPRLPRLEFDECCQIV
jgi:3-hydroxypropanoate dehydrogenase